MDEVQPSPASNDDRAPEGGQISIFGLLALMLRRKRLLVTVPLIVMAVAAAVKLIVPDGFTATSVFLPNSAAQPSRLGGLAADLGLGARAGGEPPQLYVELVHSYQLLKVVVETEIRVGGAEPSEDGHIATLPVILEIEGDDAEAQLKRTIAWLRENVRVTPAATSTLIYLRVNAPTADLAEAINRRILTLINEFNIARRREVAAAEREFVESRLVEAQSALATAENSLQRFLEANRRIEDSPDLVFELERRQRNVQLQQNLHMALVTSFEQAKLEEVRSTPVVTVVDGPEESSTRGGRGWPVVLAVALVLGLGLAVTLMLAVEYLAYVRGHHPEEIGAMKRAWRTGGARETRVEELP